MKKLFIIIFVSTLSSGLSAYDIEGSLQSGMAGSVLFTKPSASGMLICPSDNLLQDQFVIESDWSRKYDLADLDRISLLAAYRYKNLTGALGLSQLGTPDYYTEKTVRATFSYHYKEMTATLITSGEIIEIGDNLGKFQAAAVGLGASYKYDNYYFGLTIDNINRPKLSELLEGENILTKIFVEIDGGERHSIAGRLVFEKYEKPMVSISQYINIAKRNALFWGLSQNPLAYGGGINVEFKRFSLNYAVSYHPVLGFSHNISFSFLSSITDKND